MILLFNFHNMKLKQIVVDKVVDQWHSRLRMCVHTSGEHFEQLLN